jgi:hypothetical protein
MKKVAAVFFVFVFILMTVTLLGCGGGSTAKKSTPAAKTTTQETTPAVSTLQGGELLSAYLSPQNADTRGSTEPISYKSPPTTTMPSWLQTNPFSPKVYPPQEGYTSGPSSLSLKLTEQGGYTISWMNEPEGMINLSGQCTIQGDSLTLGPIQSKEVNTQPADVGTDTVSGVWKISSDGSLADPSGTQWTCDQASSIAQFQGKMQSK